MTADSAGASSILLLLATVLALSPAAHPQANSRHFLEAGKTVGGKFLDYRRSHGGLAQQGYPGRTLGRPSAAPCGRSCEKEQ